jgi:Ca-activated chloride channel homolog
MMCRLNTQSGESIPLLGVEVVGDVLGGHAHIAVRQRYQNAEARPVEAIYTFPLPSDGTLVGFAMACDGRTIEGVVKEREAAFRDYDDAVLEGHGAALVEQERANVFTASVGNLLPGEETVIEVRYIQRLHADEGALRVMIPTLVAPRYVPGTSTPTPGERTAHGTVNPTVDVTDADRISPPIGKPGYGLSLELTFALGDLEVESPSHDVRVVRDGEKTRVSLRRDEVALDRDVVVIARGVAAGPMKAAAVHREGDEGVVALTVVPELGGGKTDRLSVVFVVDTSGSMQGASIEQARAALRLCLRHLREGDRFNVIRFASDHDALFGGPEPFTQKTLDRADKWVEGLVANGGTEMRTPLVEAVRQAPSGVVILLTDGQVGNEDQILQEVVGARKDARLYTFGIGTNVSDVLLRDLARESGGAVELIHPGERIDEKVVAQFARATARRVKDVKVSFRGFEGEELAPTPLPALVDNEPWVLYLRTRGRGVGEIELRGELDGEPYYLGLPVDLDGAGAQPLLPKLWAAERVRSLDAEGLSGRRQERMKERIVAIAVKYGIASRYTSFIAVEKRTGDRRASGYPETRVVPVHTPAGWDMFKAARPPLMGGAVRTMTMVGAAAPMAAQPGMIAAAPTGALRAKGGGGGFLDRARAMFKGAAAGPEDAPPAPPAPIMGHVTTSVAPPSSDPIVTLLQAQLASGLWGPPHDDSELQARATARAMLQLLRAGVGAAHAVYGAQVKKAIDAARRLALRLKGEPALREILVDLAWLLAEGKRLRGEIANELAGPADETRLRGRVDELAASL